MISNAAVRRLIETDRETLIDLMAIAYARGRMGGGTWNIYLDPDVKELIELAWQRNGRTDNSKSYAELQCWNNEMKGI